MANYSDLRTGGRVRITRSGWNSNIPVGTEGVVTDRDRYATVNGSVRIRLADGTEHWRSVDNVEKVEPVAVPGTFAPGAIVTVSADAGTCNADGERAKIIRSGGDGYWTVRRIDSAGNETGCPGDAVRESLLTLDSPTANTLTHSAVRDLISAGRTKYRWCDARFEVLDELSIPRDAPVEPTVSTDDVLRVFRSVGTRHGVLSQVNELLAENSIVPSGPQPGVFEIGDTVKWVNVSSDSSGERYVVRVNPMGGRILVNKATLEVLGLVNPPSFIKTDD